MSRLFAIQYLSDHLMRQRFFLEIMFDGTNYHGWQIQPNSTTVQSRLELALSTILNQKINVVGAGRTDAGVHAKQMMAHFDSNISINTSKLIYRLNSFLENEISVTNLFNVRSDAHARFDAISRTYNYHIHYHKNPFLINKSWYFHKPLNVKLMNLAASKLLNYQDFTSFSKSNTQTKTNLCKVKYVLWQTVNNELLFTIEANRFLRNMVRAIVGTLVAVGEQKISIAEFESIVESKNRENAGFSVPAHGLYLSTIKYPESIFNGK